MHLLRTKARKYNKGKTFIASLVGNHQTNQIMHINRILVTYNNDNNHKCILKRQKPENITGGKHSYHPWWENNKPIKSCRKQNTSYLHP